MALDTTYGPGFSKTTTGNYDVGSPSMGGGTDLSEIAKAIIARKNADAAAREQQNHASIQALAPSMPAPERKDEMAKLRDRDARIQMQARQAPPPMRMTYPWGSAGFLTQDPDAMNAYQRQLYLPQGSQQSGGFGPGAASTLPDEGPSLDTLSNPAGTANDRFLINDNARRTAQMQALRGRG